MDKSVAELGSDKRGVETEIAAVFDYLAKIEGECIAKAETNEERTARRTAEIAGLTSLLQPLVDLAVEGRFPLQGAHC